MNLNDKSITAEKKFSKSFTLVRHTWRQQSMQVKDLFENNFFNDFF